jgi:hypothetical protein
MRKTIFLWSILIAAVTSAAGQSVFSSREFGFSMKEPTGWVSVSKADIGENLAKLEFNDEVRERILRDNAGKMLLFAFAEQKPGSVSGVIPKIEARVISNRQNRALVFEEFKPAAVAALRALGKNYEAYEYIVEPSEVSVDGVRSVYHVSRFTVKTEKGDSHLVRSRTYFIPYKTYFFQISFSDDPKNSDRSKLFDELVGSIRIGK